ncbi:MAG: hypothetical protein JSS43_11145 [Proteobacteria bacterium]|nr:hypothetical protein [Pseudomonadota bacterium]
MKGLLPGGLAVAALCAAPSLAAGQVFDQGTIETRSFRNPDTAREAASHGHGIETEDIFGFTLGSDTEQKGALLLELENVAGFGSRDQSYSSVNSKLQVTYGVTDWFSASLGILGGYYYIKDRPPGFSVTDTGATVPTDYLYPQINNYRFAGIGGELRLNLLKRQDNVVGVTLHAEPSFRMADEVSGERGNGYGSENKLIIDRELVADRLFGAINVIYDFESFKAYDSPSTEKQSAFGLSGALTYQWAPGFFFGGEIRWLRAYDGMGLNTYQGQGVFLGPSMFWHFLDNAYLSAAFSWQVTGSVRDQASTINLVNFQRQQLKFKLVYEF